jgi:hypothetical protein
MAKFDPFLTAAKIVDCVCAALKSDDRDLEERWQGDCCVFPGGGTPASVQCCEGRGLLSVNVQSGYPTTRFPQQDPGGIGGCDSPALKNMATLYTVKATRCVGLPSIECGCDCREKNAAYLLGDLKAILAGISCCFDPNDNEHDCAQYVLGTWSLLPPLGGCSGVVVPITVESDGACCPAVAP